MLSRLFHPDAPLWAFLAKVADLVWVNLMAAAFSLPVVTIGASLTAVHDCVHQILHDSGGGATRMFLTSWRSNLRQATTLWLIVAPVGLGIAAAWLTSRSPLTNPLIVLVSITFLLTWPLLWQLQARLHNTVGRTLLNASAMAMARLPYTIATLAITAAFAAAWWLTVTEYPQALPIIALLGYPGVVAAQSPLLERALAPLLAAAADSTNND